MGVLIFSKMLVLASMLSAVIISCQALSPLTAEELKQIRDFTADAHMKRLQNFPDQLMTPSTHYLGRRIPSSSEKKQPPIFMQAPNNNGGAAVKQTTFQIEPQPAGAVQNYLINYPITTNTINQAQSGPIFHRRPQQAAPIQFAPQNGGHINGPPRGPPPHYKRPSFFSFGGPESSPPTSLLQLFFPKRPARRPPSYRPPLRFEYAQTAHNPIFHHHNQNLQAIMAQQHLLAVQQQAQVGQQSVAQPSTAPITAQSTTVKNTLNAQVIPTVVVPSAVASVTATSTAPAPSTPANTNAGPVLIQNQQNFLTSQPNPSLFNLNQFHREVPFFGKPFGKPGHPHKFGPVNPSYLPENRPGDDVNYIQKYASPQPDFSFIPFGPPAPPHGGPNSNRFSSPVSFTHIEQMPFPLQPQQLQVPVVVQSQEFPNYHFTTTFTASNSDAPASPPPTSVSNTVFIDNTNEQIRSAPVKPQTVSQGHGQAGSFQSTTIRQTHRVKKIRPRPTTAAPITTTSTTPPPLPAQSLGDVIFESAKETREFHDIAHLNAPTISNLDSVVVKPRKPKQHKTHQQQQQVSIQQHQQQYEPAESNQKVPAATSVVLAPLVFTGESNLEHLPPSSSPRPITSTLVSISTISTTTQEPYKSKVVKSKGVAEYHSQKPKHTHYHQEKRVTASGAGQGAATATVEPLRVTSTGTLATTSSGNRNTITPGGRVVTTSVTSRVVSIGPQNPQKRYRLRKVKVPNPDAIKTNNKTSAATTLSSFSTSSSSSTTNTPSNTTPLSTRTPRSTTTISSTESSLTTTAV